MAATRSTSSGVRGRPGAGGLTAQFLSAGLPAQQSRQGADDDTRGNCRGEQEQGTRVGIRDPPEGSAGWPDLEVADRIGRAATTATCAGRGT